MHDVIIIYVTCPQQRWNPVRIFDPWPDPTRPGRWALWNKSSTTACYGRLME